MSRFLRFLITVTAICHVPFVVAGAEALRRIGVDLWPAWIVAILSGIAGVLLFPGRAKHSMDDAKRSFATIFLVDVPYYVHWCACIYCIIPSLLYVIGEPIVDAISGLPIGPSPGFFFWTYASGLVVCFYGCVIRRWWFVTRRVDIPVRNLPKAFDGYRIVHLSDLHIGGLTPYWWGKRWIDAANDEKADTVVVTGDMVTSGVAFHDDIARLVGELRTNDGPFVIMGNHDYFGEGEPLITLLVKSGARVLRNEGLVLERDGGRIFMAGIDDTWTKRADIVRALEGRPDDVPTILLAHDPDRFPQYVKRGVDLVLSGHTHGGQVAVPFLARFINASKLAHHFHIGLYEDGDARLYVHPGLGTTGPPIRLGVAPAIIVLTLRAA